MSSFGHLFTSNVTPEPLRSPYGVPGGTFNYSPYIKEFHIDPDNPFYSVIDESLYSKDGKKTLFLYLTIIGKNLLYQKVWKFLRKELCMGTHI